MVETIRTKVEQSKGQLRPGFTYELARSKFSSCLNLAFHDSLKKNLHYFFRMTVEEKKKKLQATVKKTIKCDVLKSNPMEPLVLPKVDCVLTFGCLECACSDLDTYRRVLKNVSTLIKIGGHLIVSEILNCSSYLLGGKRFSCLVLTKEFMRSAIIETGFTIVDLEVIPRKYDKEQYELCNHDSSLFVLARKERDV